MLPPEDALLTFGTDVSLSSTEAWLQTVVCPQGSHDKMP